MPTTFYNVTVTIDDDDAWRAYRTLGKLINQPIVRTWMSDTYSVDKVEKGELIRGEEQDTSDHFGRRKKRRRKRESNLMISMVLK